MFIGTKIKTNSFYKVRPAI